MISAAAPRPETLDAGPELPVSRIMTVVVAYNGAAVIGDCLQSLIDAGSEPGDILVIDNASSDGTPELVRMRFPKVRLVVSSTNVGYGEAINEASRLSTTEYLAVINQDAVAMPGWAGELAQALDARPDAGMATAKVLIRANPSVVNAAGNNPHFTGITPCRGFGQPSADFRTVEEVPAISGAAFLVRRELLLELGGFDASFFLYFEDTDLSLRMRLAGHPCVLAPAAEVLHEFAPSFSPAKLLWLERNRLTAWFKIFRWRTLVLLAPALLLTELIVLAYAASRGSKSVAAKVRAYREILDRLPATLASRSRVQASRRLSDSELLPGLDDELDVQEMGHGLGRLAMIVVNPFFRAWYRLARSIVSW